MNHHRLNRFFAAAALLCALGAVAAGDPAAGESKSVTCAACHGPDGNSVVGEWPKIAGQHAGYIARQLQLYKDGGRENAVMLGMVAGLSPQDMQDLGAYYATMTVKPGVADSSLVALGERVFRGGNAVSGVPACMACHGPRGRGNPGSGYPALNGQHAQYTANVLRQFKAGAVWGNGDAANAIMATIAANLTEDEIVALASYIEGLH